mmetsp:Transcript_91176/g.162343  ORF Transcript_91176/g.162343 Transcript_91176/m.162343 type:complete len:291 (-) Transcript_91176:684-1556(-)
MWLDTVQLDIGFSLVAAHCSPFLQLPPWSTTSGTAILLAAPVAVLAHLDRLDSTAALANTTFARIVMPSSCRLQLLEMLMALSMAHPARNQLGLFLTRSLKCPSKRTPCNRRDLLRLLGEGGLPRLHGGTTARPLLDQQPRWTCIHGERNHQLVVMSTFSGIRDSKSLWRGTLAVCRQEVEARPRSRRSLLLRTCKDTKSFNSTFRQSLARLNLRCGMARLILALDQSSAERGLPSPPSHQIRQRQALQKLPKLQYQALHKPTWGSSPGLCRGCPPVQRLQPGLRNAFHR